MSELLTEHGKKTLKQYASNLFRLYYSQEKYPFMLQPAYDIPFAKSEKDRIINCKEELYARIILLMTLLNIESLETDYGAQIIKISLG